MNLHILDDALFHCRIRKFHTGIMHHIPAVYCLVIGLTSVPKFHCTNGQHPNLRYILRDIEYDQVVHFAAWLKADYITTAINPEYNMPKLSFRIAPDEPFAGYECEAIYDNYGMLQPDKSTMAGGRNGVFHHRRCISLHLFTSKEQCITYGFEHGYFDIDKIINKYKYVISTLEQIANALVRYDADYIRPV